MSDLESDEEVRKLDMAEEGAISSEREFTICITTDEAKLLETLRNLRVLPQWT